MAENLGTCKHFLILKFRDESVKCEVRIHLLGKLKFTKLNLYSRKITYEYLRLLIKILIQIIEFITVDG